MNAAHRKFDTVAAILLVLTLGFVLVEYLWAPHKKPVFVWHDVPGYSAGIALISCLIIIVLSKALAALFLQRADTASKNSEQYDD